MLLAHGTIVAVADGETLNLYRNSGSDREPALVAMPAQAPKGDDGDGEGGVNAGSGGRHHISAANPDGEQRAEDNFAAATAAYLNAEVLAHRIDHLVVIAAPRTLGELRHHWHKALTAALVAEIPKEMTGHSVADIAEMLDKHG